MIIDEFLYKSNNKLKIIKLYKRNSTIMSKSLCETCKVNKALIKRPKTGSPICQTCFYVTF